MREATYRIIPARAEDGGFVEVLVSPEDYGWARSYHWSLSNGYARRGVGDPDGRRRNIYMHREILDLAPGNPLTGDHINRDRLDNRRSNLRAVTMAENNTNLGSRGGTSKYRGVHWNKDRSAWHAQARLNNHAKYLGLFPLEDDAARAVNAFWTANGYPPPNEISSEAA